ncbi:APC family permease [[Acholeplasma] multilocale]|uniref:APC family permease n=1 Tax=[Acholeplasma] multilocale TaxID=264638 RepID=UPI00047DA7B1|nr:APC family permease [[Acholeplasma] multilocale]
MTEKVKKKGLRIIDLIAISFSAIFALDSFAMAAAIGWQSIIFWIILALLFFIPYGLISSELGSTYVDGGINSWVRRVFGTRWAARTSWFYWLNVSIWMSASYIVFAATISYMFFDGTLTIWTQVAIAAGLTILTVLISLLKEEWLRYIPNSSSIAKVIVTLLLVVATIVFLAKGNGVSTPIDDPGMGIVPSWSTGLLFILVIIYNLCGFELGSNQVLSMKNPQKDIPKATLVSGITIVVAYVIGTVAINILVDVSDDFDIANGLIVALGRGLPVWLTNTMGILLIYSLFGTMMTWVIGANLGAVEAAEDDQLPIVFGSKFKPTGQPLGASVLTGAISIVCLLIAGFTSKAGDTETGDLFEALFSFQSVVFLIPYLLIFPSFYMLRKKDKEAERPFTIPGNKYVIFMITFVPFFLIIAALFLLTVGDLIIQPEEGIDWAKSGMKLGFTIGGSLFSILVGEVLIRIAEKNVKKKSERQIKEKEQIQKGA